MPQMLINNNFFPGGDTVVTDLDSFVVTPDLINNPVITSGGTAALRDPTNIIKVGSTYYCYTTHVLSSESLYPAGYEGTVYVLSSPDMVVWTLGAKMVDKGGSGADDETGCFTPSMFVEDGVYYLVYTGVDGTFNYPTVVPKKLLLATATSPSGPFTKQGTVITPGGSGSWSEREGGLDDATMIKIGDEYRIYHSAGAAGTGVDSEKRTGYAYASDPLGPYTDYASNPVVSPTAGYTAVESPNIFLHNDLYHYISELHNSDQVGTVRTDAISHYTSTDGKTWTYQGLFVENAMDTLNTTATFYAPSVYLEGGYAKRMLFMYTPTSGAMTIGICELSHRITVE